MIYLLCLHDVRTGGPEAIHQLSDALLRQSFDARMVYYDWTQIAALELAKPQEGYVFGTRETPFEEYRRYLVEVVDCVPNEPGAVVVLSESICHLAPKFDKATVLIWWLSVDNAFAALSKVNLNHLRKPNVKHAAQSEYAARFCDPLGFSCKHWLTDYTADLTEYAIPMPTSERPRRVVFNSNHKVTSNVAAISSAIYDRDPTIEREICGGLSRAQMAERFARARIYVDLGCFPGKDRMPREAALMGCVPLVLSVGAFRGTTHPHVVIGDDDPGFIAETVINWIDRPSLLQTFIGPWLHEIAQERRVFQQEVHDVFGGLT